MKIIKRIVKWLMVAAVSVFVLSALTVIFFGYYRPAIKKADAIIVLGAAINTPALTNRTLEGLLLYEQGKANIIVLSGGRISDQDISEAQFMQKTINKNSSGTVNTILDQNSHSTYENIKDSKMLLPAKQSVIIVSDSFHLARAVILARRAGFSPVYWSSPPEIAYKKSEIIFYYFREAVAFIDYVPKFLFN